MNCANVTGSSRLHWQALSARSQGRQHYSCAVNTFACQNCPYPMRGRNQAHRCRKRPREQSRIAWLGGDCLPRRSRDDDLSPAARRFRCRVAHRNIEEAYTGFSLSPHCAEGRSSVRCKSQKLNGKFRISTCTVRHSAHVLSRYCSWRSYSRHSFTLAAT
jgi:hypothetical protein